MTDELYLFDSYQEAYQWLMHYGVKGMKWGVRKDNKTNFNDYTIESGTTIGSTNNKNLKGPVKGYFLENDRNLYASHLLDFRDNQKIKKMEMLLEAKADIKIASMDTTISEFTKMFENKTMDDMFTRWVKEDMDKGVILSSVVRSISKDKNSKMKLNIEKVNNKDIERIKEERYGTLQLDDPEFRNKLLYSRFSESLMLDSPERKEFFKTLIQKGYGGIADYNDTNNQIATNPIILIDPKKTVSVERRRVISDFEKEYHTMSKDYLDGEITKTEYDEYQIQSKEKIKQMKEDWHL